MDAAAPRAPALVEFTAPGPAPQLAAAIEAFAAERRLVTALVVPWESEAATLRMAVTSSRSDGWAIEHTNLGTIVLTDLEGGRTWVAVCADPSAADGTADAQRGALLAAFARQLEKQFGAIA